VAARKTRVNFTLSPENVKAAQAIAEERGLKLSTFVDRAIAAYVKQLREPAAPPTSPQLRTIGDLEAAADKRVRTLFPELFLEWFERYLEAKYGDNRLEMVIGQVVGKALEQCETVPRPPPGTATPEAPPTPTAVVPTSTPKAAKSTRAGSRPLAVDVPEETRERLMRFSIAELIEATGMDRGTLSMVRTGKRPRLQVSTYNRVIAGLEQLESRT
jgi:hypothetical protein